MKIKVSRRFFPLLENKYRYLIMYGGAGSGKSEFAGRKLFYRCMKEGNHKILILRKIGRTARQSVVALMKTILDENEVKYSYNESFKEMLFYSYEGKKNIILFDGVDDPEKIKSIKGLTTIWMEEATEFSSKDFKQVNMRLREKTDNYKQIMLTFNPDEAQAAWLKEMFFFDELPKTGEGKREDSYLHHSTIEDNPISEIYEEYLRVLESETDPALKSIYRLGIWAAVKGLIYPAWDIVSKTKEQEKLSWGEIIKPDEVIYGGDFGYSANETGVTKIFIKGMEFWLQTIIYEKGLTNDKIAEKLTKDERVNIKDDSYWDSAEPKSIDELYADDINAKPALKGPDSVRAGIKFLQGLTIHILDDSMEINTERKSYKWKEDKNGYMTDQPVKFRDHLLDGIRYAIYTHCKRERGYSGWSEEDWRD